MQDHTLLSLEFPRNEQVLNYGPGSVERKKLEQALARLRSMWVEAPMYIDGKEIFTNQKKSINPPHDINHTLGYFHVGSAQHVTEAIEAALKVATEWASTPWSVRASIFLKAAELIATKYRFELNAATMLCQSKNVYQAEIDSACEIVDFLRYNVYFANQIYAMQPSSASGVWNRTDYRPLEGFIYALTPFNFTAIAGNLPTAPAIMGNVVVWKPADSQIYSAWVFMKILIEAGLPKGVINLIYVDGPEAGEVVFSHPDFAGLHFTGSTNTFDLLYQKIALNLKKYKNYPRIVGETGGKDFVLADDTADPQALAVALVRGAFEYQGQKCSAASRAYIPESIWDQVSEKLLSITRSLKMGGTETFSNFINAVIDKKAFDKIKSYIEFAKNDPKAEILIGGTCDDTVGYFIEPTIIKTTDPYFKTMVEEIFGPVLTIYVYKENVFEMAQVLNKTSDYALTGSIFSQNKLVVQELKQILNYAAGNLYINDKPTGAVVGQQPFGGGRKSGTNDKSGSMLNLLRWVSPRTIKENFNPPVDYEYPFLKS